MRAAPICFLLLGVVRGYSIEGQYRPGRRLRSVEVLEKILPLVGAPDCTDSQACGDGDVVGDSLVDHMGDLAEMLTGAGFGCDPSPPAAPPVAPRTATPPNRARHTQADAVCGA